VNRPLLCDCGCGQQMAVDHGDRIVVKARHHGQDHLLTISKFIDVIDSREFEDELRERVHSSSN